MLPYERSWSSVIEEQSQVNATQRDRIDTRPVFVTFFLYFVLIIKALKQISMLNWKSL